MVGTIKIFNTTDTELKNRNGQKIKVLRALTEDEADISDVGNMYKAEFPDGYIGDVFEDELKE